MNLFELFVKIGVDDKASKNLANITGKLGNGLKTAAKIGTAAVSAAAAGITALTGAAVKNYAEYEQLVGGVDTLFKSASKKVQQYAADAYKTAGMSANAYMENATAFSASLIGALGGDTEKAAEYANRAMVSMSDNANKMGTSIDSIVLTYQSLSRGNFAMLDNLKLGYGGTKKELERLIKDAASYTDIQKEMGVTVDASSMSFDNIVNAIAVVQGKLGIAGATALEAGTTIEGSVNSMKAAWSNLITGLADKNADIEDLVGKLVTSIVGDGTENNLGVLGNVMPAVKTALNGAAKLVSELLPAIVEQVPAIINENLPILAGAAISIVQSLVDGISDNQEMLMKTVIDTIVFLSKSLISMLPQIVQLGLELIVSLATGIAESLPELIPTVVQTIVTIVNTLTNPEMLSKILDAALLLVVELAYGLMDAIPQLVDACITIIENIIEFLLDPENTAKLINAGIKIIIAISVGLLNGIAKLDEGINRIIAKIKEKFKETDWQQVGKNIVDGLLDGLKNAWKSLTKWWFGDAWDGLVDGVKKVLGIHSPSRVFAGIGKNMALGIGEGWNDAFGGIEKDIMGSLGFGDIPSSGLSYGSYSGDGVLGGAVGGTTFGTVNINIEGYNAQDDDELAEMIAEKLQIMTERRGAVFA